MHQPGKYILNYVTRFCYSLLGNQGDDSVILMFHEVDLEKTKVGSYMISQNDFIERLEAIGSKLKPISLSEFNFRRKTRLFKGYYILTFDDGYKGVIKYAYPYLKEKQIPFAVFITTDYIGKTGYMTWEDICCLKDEPLCCIGAHTCTHPKLRDIKEADWEIEQSKRILEAKIGKKIEYFAYPYGNLYACSLSNIRQVKRAGFQMAFSTIDASLNSISCLNAFFIPRVCGERYSI